MNRQSFSSLVRMQQPWVGAVVVCAAAGLYLSTLQTDINGIRELVDTGEFQNALYLWGIAHPTGYPLYLLVGGVFVHLAHVLGVNPAAGASLFSTAGALGALAFFFASLQTQTRRTSLAASLTLVLAVVGPFWFRSIDAEVYSWGFFFAALALYLAVCFVASPRPVLLLALLFTLGTGIAHHRFVALIAPAILLWIARDAVGLIRGDRRLVLWSLAALLAPFAIYLYLPLRAHWGTQWRFAAADTWTGFASLFTGRGYLESSLALPTDITSWLARLSVVWTRLADQLTSVGVALTIVAAGALWILASTRRVALFVTVGVGAPALFAVFYRIREIDAYLLPATMFMLFGAAVAIAALSKRWPLAVHLTTTVALLLALFLALHNYPAAHAVSANRRGRDLLDALGPVVDGQTVVVAPWGTDFFAFWYGKYVTGEIAAADVVTPDAPLKAELYGGKRVYASKDIFYLVPLEEWDRVLGRTFVWSAGSGIVELSDRPALAPALEGAAGEATFGSLVTLVRHEVAYTPERRALRLTLYWRAERDIAEDYSVMVHLVDHTQEDRIIMQADSVNPVYGFYRTSRWQNGEIVRDDYELLLPRDAPLASADLVVGWYRMDPGQKTFQNLGTVRMAAYPLAP